MCQEFNDNFYLLFNDTEIRLRRLLQQKLRTIQKCKDEKHIRDQCEHNVPKSPFSMKHKECGEVSDKI